MYSVRLINGVRPGRRVQFEYEGRTFTGYEGEGVALALMRAGVTGTRLTPREKQPRGYYCGMGVCWDCVIDVVGVGSVRGCQHPVSEGLVVRAERLDGAGSNES